MQQSSKHGQSAYTKSVSGNAIPEPEEELSLSDPQEHQLTSFYRRQHTLNQPSIRQMTQRAVSKLTSLPKNFITSSALVIDNMNTRLIEEQLRLLAHKTRPPRYTSFTMQLETYSYKKA